jgi:hypothetical protein
MAKRNNSPTARETSLESAAGVLKRHFAGLGLANLITASREYPVPARVDLQRAIDELLPSFSRSRQMGIHAEYAHETLTMGHLLGNHHSRVVIGPLQYEEIDVGEAMAVHFVRRALWLARHGRLPFALVVGQAVQYGMPSGTIIEVGAPPGERGAELVRYVLDNIESRVKSASSYRGKVLSLEAAQRYTGDMGPIRVHKLKQVAQDQLVLPAKKGLLFYGPPGTGKTYTIHYLAARLREITSESLWLDHIHLGASGGSRGLPKGARSYDRWSGWSGCDRRPPNDGNPTLEGFCGTARITRRVADSVFPVHQIGDRRPPRR